MEGHHLTADLTGCPDAARAMTGADALKSRCLNAVRHVGLIPVAERFQGLRHSAGSADPGPPVGVTGVVWPAESHLAVHTGFESGAVTLDAGVCTVHADDKRSRADRRLETLCRAFASASIDRQALHRGRPGGERTLR